MKTIGIDARLYSQTGVGVYIRNLMYFLEKNLTKDWFINLYLRAEDFDSVKVSHERINKRRANYRWHSLSEQTDFLRLLNADKLDLMHFTYFSFPIHYKRPFVSTIHDLTPILLPTGKASTKNRVFYYAKYLAAKKVFSSQVKNARTIITPTHAVKDQILDYFGNDHEKKINVIYEGIDIELKSIEENKLLAKKLPHDFFIYIGNFYPHKNVESLIKAFAETDIKRKLVLVGPDGYFSQKIQQLIIQLKQSQRIIMYSDFNKEDFIYLYKHARALLNPSLAEGFGLTNLEAMYFHCPVVASNIAVFEEVLTSEYLPFDPKNITDIADKINYASKHKLNFDYENVLKKFSFEQMTMETIDVYKKALNA